MINMRRTMRCCLALVVMGASGASRISAAQGNSEEAHALLQRARDLSDITLAGCPPFRLHARFQAVEAQKKNPLEGTLELTWNSDTRWRLEITSSSYKETLVGGTGSVWIARNAKYRPVVSGQLVGLLTLIRHVDFTPDESVKEIKGTSPNGRPVRCFEISPKKGVKRVLCVDSDAGTLVYEHIFDIGALGYEYGDYITAGDKQFPRKLRIYHGEKLVLEAQVDALVLNPPTEAPLFEPPAGARERPGCFAPEPAKPLKAVNPEYPIGARIRGEQGVLSVYAVIGADGRIHDKAVFRSVSPEVNGAALRALDQWQFQPATCNGVPVPSEDVIDLSFTLNPP